MGDNACFLQGQLLQNLAAQSQMVTVQSAPLSRAIDLPSGEKASQVAKVGNSTEPKGADAAGSLPCRESFSWLAQKLALAAATQTPVSIHLLVLSWRIPQMVIHAGRGTHSSRDDTKLPFARSRLNPHLLLDNLVPAAVRAVTAPGGAAGPVSALRRVGIGTAAGGTRPSASARRRRRAAHGRNRQRLRRRAWAARGRSRRRVRWR